MVADVDDCAEDEDDEGGREEIDEERGDDLGEGARADKLNIKILAYEIIIEIYQHPEKVSQVQEANHLLCYFVWNL